jgi:serine/alanine racemase
VYSFIIKILGTARDGFFFAPIFIVIGALLARNRVPNLKSSAIGFGISFAGLILEVSLYAWLGVLDTLSCMFLMLIPCVYFLMAMLLRLPVKTKGDTTILRAESTLIYVSHILFARILFILLPDQNLTVYVATLACSQLFAYIVIKESRRFGWLKVLY